MTGRSGIASGKRMILAAVALLILSGNVHGDGIVGRDLSRGFKDRMGAYVCPESQESAARNTRGCASMSSKGSSAAGISP